MRGTPWKSGLLSLVVGTQGKGLHNGKLQRCTKTPQERRREIKREGGCTIESSKRCQPGEPEASTHCGINSIRSCPITLALLPWHSTSSSGRRCGQKRPTSFLLSQGRLAAKEAQAG